MRYLAFILMMTGLSPPVFGQEFLPFIVRGPETSDTAFVSWKPIHLTYHLRWLDGYEPMWTDIKPESMNFSPFELDPNFPTDKVEKINERQNPGERKIEYYADVVYHLRYATEKKGEIIIAPQVFRYRELKPGRDKSQMDIQSFKTQKFILRYDTTLTSDASAIKIKDYIDFGSFLYQARLWHWGAVSLFFLLSGSTLFLTFRHPVVDLISINVAGDRKIKSLVVPPKDHLKELLTATNRLAVACRQDNLGADDFYNTVVVTNSAILSVLHLYTPGVTLALTSPELGKAIESITLPWLKDQLSVLNQFSSHCQDYLYLVDRTGEKEPTEEQTKNLLIHTLFVKKRTVLLKPRNIVWQKRLWQLQQRTQTFVDSFKRLSKWGH